jgi:signal transduction histidine kinase
MSARRRAGVLVVSAWTALAVFFALTTSLTYISLGQPPIWGLALAYSLTQWWLWALLTPVVVVAARRWPFSRPRAAISLPVHLAIGAAVAYAKVWLEGQARRWLFDAEPYLLINNLALQFLIYLALVAAVHAVDHYGRTRARAAEATARLHEARLDLLTSQVQPHMLFNALNTVSEMIHEDPERADRMVGRLSDLLRATLEARDRPFVSLDEEIEVVRDYLAIQEARFSDRLRVEIDVPADCAAIAVPHLILQPLVENAIRHGIAPRPGAGRLTVRAATTSGLLTLTVADDGAGWPADARDGIGLGNTRARLAATWGARAALSVRAGERGGTIATIVLPARGIGEVPA